MNRQRVDCLRLPGFAKPLSRHFCEKVADTLSLETEWSEIGHCKSRIIAERLVINATQFLRALFKRPPRSYNPVRRCVGLLKGAIVPQSSRINSAFILVKWCPFSSIKGAVIVVKWCLTGTKTRCSKWQRTIIEPRWKVLYNTHSKFTFINIHRSVLNLEENLVLIDAGASLDALSITG